MVMLPDIFPFGIAFERLAAMVTQADAEFDQHQLADMEFHLDTFIEHKAGAETARARGDFYNAFVEEADAAINAFFAWVVTSRIVDPSVRAQGFEELNRRLGI